MPRKVTLEFIDEEEIKLDGIVYATAHRLAERFGLSAGRIAHLARNGDIESEPFGRTWFISETSLDHYLLLGRKGRANERTG
jgi:hypothetical protein